MKLIDDKDLFVIPRYLEGKLLSGKITMSNFLLCLKTMYALIEIQEQYEMDKS